MGEEGRKNKMDKDIMDKDIMDAEEMCKKVKEVREDLFQKRWESTRETINDSIKYAITRGFYEINAVNITCRNEEDDEFLDFVVKKLTKKGYNISVNINRYKAIATIAINCRIDSDGGSYTLNELTDKE